MRSITYGHTKLWYAEPFVMFYKDAQLGHFKNSDFFKISGGLSHAELYSKLIEDKTVKKSHEQVLIRYLLPTTEVPTVQGLKKEIDKLSSNLVHMSHEKVLNLLVSKNLATHRLQQMIVTTVKKTAILPYIVKKLGNTEYQIAIPVFYTNKILTEASRADKNFKIE